jgi:hypothetical protein
MALIYSKHMTPKWLNNRKSETIEWFVDGVIEQNTVLKIPADSINYERIVTIGLIAPGVTTNSDNLVFKIVISLEHPSPIIEPVPPPARSRDPLSVMISDGKNAVGIQIQDPEDYPTLGPYIGIQGLTGDTLTNVTRNDSQMDHLDKIPATERRRWPQVFEIIIRNNVTKPKECSASCYSAIRGGTGVTATFANPLMGNAQWDLELYRGERAEAYNINFINVSIYTEDEFVTSRTW